MKWIAVILALLPVGAWGGEVRFYGPDGSRKGSSYTDSSGSTRYYDQRGQSAGTSTTTGRYTTFYDTRGKIVGKAIK